MPSQRHNKKTKKTKKTNPLKTHNKTHTKTHNHNNTRDEYLVHGTYYENLLNILKDGYIDIKPKSKNAIIMLDDKPPRQIFTQLLYYDIPNQANTIPHWMTSAIILDKQLLADYPFYATHIKGFKQKFNNGLINNETNTKYDNEILVRGKGNLEQIPNLSKLKNHIANSMYVKSPIDSNYFKFRNSHEILFNKKIPLVKYCKIIMILGKKSDYKNSKGNRELSIIKEIVELAKQKNIPLKFRDYKLRGNNEKPINNFIDSIESIENDRSS
jgi:hypothetical protein